MQGVDVSEKTEFVSTFYSRVQSALKRASDAGEKGPADFYFRLQGNNKGKAAKSIVSNLPVSGDYDTDIQTLVEALESASGDPYRSVTLALMPVGASTPLVRENIPWFDNEELSIALAPAKSSGEAGLNVLEKAHDGMAGAMVATNEQLRRSLLIYQQKNEVLSQKLLDMAIEYQRLISEGSSQSMAVFGETMVQVTERLQTPLAQWAAVFEERFKAERAQKVSSEDRESERYEKGFSAGREAVKEEAVLLFASVEKLYETENDAEKMQLKAALFNDITRVFGASTAAKVAAFAARVSS